MRWLLLAACMLFSAVVFAQPSNDNCSGALNIPISATGACNNTVVSTTVAATSSGVPTCVGTAEDDIWFKFTATSTAHVISLYHMFSSFTDPVIELMSGTCGSLTSIKCSQHETGTFTAIDYFDNLVPGVEYFVRVYDMNANSARNTVSVCVYVPVANDDCSGAISLPVNTDTSWAVYTSGSLQYATATGPYCLSGNYFLSQDVWFKFVATDTVQLIDFNTPSNSFGNTLRFGYIVYSGSCGSLTPIAPGNPTNPESCNVGGSDFRSFSDYRRLTPGNTYYIRVLRDSVDAPMTFSIALSNVPHNDICENAIDVPVNSADQCTLKAVGNFKNATATSQPTVCSIFAQGGPDVWFKFTATSTRHIIAVKDPAGITARMEIYSGTCGSLTPLTCGSTSYSEYFPKIVLSGLTPGAVYYARVFGGSGLFHETAFEVCITTPSTGVPYNDDCANASVLSPTLGDFSLGVLLNATASPTQPPSSGCDNTAKDVWYTVTPAYNAHITVKISPSGHSTGYLFRGSVAAFSGTCGSLVFLACSNNIPSNEQTVTFTGLAGQTYYISASAGRSSSGGEDAGPFGILVSQANALPVTLTDFRIGNITEKSIGLSWQTTQESKIRAYAIQRSMDGASFSDIGSITARNQAANQYSFTDDHPLAGRNYYRLKIVDVDGAIEYSKIIDARLKGSGDFSMYATQSGIRIVNEKNTSIRSTLSIYDGMGRLLSKQDIILKPGANSINNVSSGIIFIQLKTSEGTIAAKLKL